MSTYHSRLQALQNCLKNYSCDALIVDDPTNIFYLTGINLSTGRIFIDSKSATLIVDSRYLETCQLLSPFPVIEKDHPAFDSFLSSPNFQHIHSIGFDSDKTSYKSFMLLQKMADSLLLTSQNHKEIRFIPLDNPILQLRSIKDSSEIQILKDAATLGCLGFDFVLSLLKEGISEIEIARELEIFWKKKGSKSLAFDPIIAFGANSSKPHHRASQTILKKGDIVLIDIGVNLNHYHSDMTRSVFFGEPDPKLKEIYLVVKEAQEAALKKCKPGTSVGDLDATARQLISSKGFGPNFTHSLGHGVGLDIHELPILKNTPPFNEITLVDKMVITIEPGIYIPGLGGVRIEDTVVITNSGYENLTNRSKELMII